MKSKEVWLECQVSDGMFPGEYTVASTTIENAPFSFFVPSDYVIAGENLVKVDLLESVENYYVVRLPAMPFENIGQIVRVPRNSIFWY